MAACLCNNWHFSPLLLSRASAGRVFPFQHCRPRPVSGHWAVCPGCQISIAGTEYFFVFSTAQRITQLTGQVVSLKGRPAGCRQRLWLAIGMVVTNGILWYMGGKGSSPPSPNAIAEPSGKW